jgi:putative lipoic acid-binding regulatory protein
VSLKPDADPKPLITYPTVYPFKVMGRRGEGFEEFVRALISTALGSEVSNDSIVENVSNKGTYVALTVSVNLLNEEQRQSIYASLHREKQRILYYL